MIHREDINLIKNIINLHNKNVDFDFLYKVLTATKDFDYLEDDILDSFSDNQIKSKSRVLEFIDKGNFINENSEVIIFGSWYGSILIPGLANKVKRITCIDLDEQVLKIAKNRLFDDIKNVDYIKADVFEKDRERYWKTDLFINTSCEHMLPMKDWPYWSNLQNDSYFVFTSNNMFGIEGHVNCVNSLEEFEAQLPDRAKVLHREEVEDTRGIRYILVGKISSL